MNCICQTQCLCFFLSTWPLQLLLGQTGPAVQTSIITTCRLPCRVWDLSARTRLWQPISWLMETSTSEWTRGQTSMQTVWDLCWTVWTYVSMFKVPHLKKVTYLTFSSHAEQMTLWFPDQFVCLTSYQTTVLSAAIFTSQCRNPSVKSPTSTTGSWRPLIMRFFVMCWLLDKPGLPHTCAWPLLLQPISSPALALQTCMLHVWPHSVWYLPEIAEAKKLWHRYEDL